MSSLCWLVSSQASSDPRTPDLYLGTAPQHTLEPQLTWPLCLRQDTSSQVQILPASQLEPQPLLLPHPAVALQLGIHGRWKRRRLGLCLSLGDQRLL